MHFYALLAFFSASALASANRPSSTQSPGVNITSITPTTVASASVATVTKLVNLTSTVTVPGTPSTSTIAEDVKAASNVTSSIVPTGGISTSALSSVCETATPSVITSVVTQVSTKTVDHFITVTVGETGSAPSPSGNVPGSKGQVGNIGRPSQNTSKAVQIPATTTKAPTPVITTISTVKPVTTVVVEQTTTVFVTSFVTTTVQIQAGETFTRSAMVTSTVTSTGMATHTRTRASTVLVTLTKTKTADPTRTATKDVNTKGSQTQATSQLSLSSSDPLSSTPCPTDPVTLTVTRSSETATTKFGVKDDTTASRSSPVRFTTKTRGASSLSATTSTVLSTSTDTGSITTRSSRFTSRPSQSRSTSVVRSTTDTNIGTSASETQSTSSVTASSTRRGRTSRTSSSTVATSTTSTNVVTESSVASETSAQITTTSARATRSASSTVSRFSTSVLSTSAVRANTRSNTRTRTSSAANASATGSADPQTSLDLDPRAVMSALANDGQDKPDPGQVASLTSRNNFINFCITQNVPLTDGQQIKGGSCNGVPMGRILAVDKMPSSKFAFPKNGQTIKANTAFTIRMAIKNLSTGNFVNPTTNYYSAPAQTTADGTLIGHSHVVIEKLTSKTQSTPTDPRKFAFFKGLNQAAVGGILTADVTAGLPAGEYRIASINSAANHQPALSAVAQRGSNDDISYFTVE
ncbi:hypothetical protein RhiTH_004392 [Rhizoctonia solani]